MPEERGIAAWKDLCLDALDVDRQADFYAEVLQLRRVGDRDHVRLEGSDPAETVWINQVDREHVVKNRIHPDVYVEDDGGIERLVDLGARLLVPGAEIGRAWSVMADPEGNEFCAFGRAPDALPDRRLHGICLDCVDAEALARWWGEVFGVPVVHNQHPGDEWWTLEDVVTPDGLTLDFGSVAEPRREPHRVHWDVVAAVDDLLAAGAVRQQDRPGWTVLTDPEGNEFCCFAPA